MINVLDINMESIKPFINNNETQIIFQRHCDYDRKNGCLLDSSIKEQEDVVRWFVDKLKKEDFSSTYFLFTSSNTVSENKFKRCVETENIAMDMISDFYEENNLNDHIMNLRIDGNYNGIAEDSRLAEPGMFIDNSGFLEYLKNKYDGINVDFWIDFEEDLSKIKREQLGSEGPDEIVARANKYIKLLQRYALYFHKKYKNSKLVIWCGTHYDLISPLVKQDVLGWAKCDSVNVSYCGGISFIINEANEIISNINGVNYPFDFQGKQLLLKRF